MYGTTGRSRRTIGPLPRTWLGADDSLVYRTGGAGGISLQLTELNGFGVPGAVAGVAIGVAGGRLLSLVMRDST